MEKYKCRIKLNEATHTEANIWELNKDLMYDFYFNYIIKTMVIKLNYCLLLPAD